MILVADRVAHHRCCNLTCRHVCVEQAFMQLAELLTQAHQFVLVAFVLPAQDLAQQGTRARHRPVALHARLTQSATSSQAGSHA
jgi:hypothetical protein